MSFRLISIGIYSRKSGALRRIDFPKKGLSVVTGQSSRGKSALLDIVDYSLLSKHCSIAKGVIRSSVSHAGAIFEGPTGDQMLVVRPLPQEGRMTSTEVHLETGTVDFPKTPPDTRWNLDRAREALSEFAGIEDLPVLSNRETTEAEDQRPANIRHCAPYLFQPQDVLASRSVLFPGVEDTWVRRHISDASDYFLGVLTVARLAKRRELQSLKADRNTALRERSERDRRSARGWERGIRLWSEAAAVGLLTTEPPATQPDLFRGLRTAAAAKITSPNSVLNTPRLEEVQRLEAHMRAKIRQLTFELAEADRIADTSRDHAMTADAKLGRLELRKLLPKSETAHCPLCGVGEVAVRDIEDMISSGLIAVQESREPPRRLSARLERRREDLRREISKAADAIKPVQIELRELFLALESEQTTLQQLGHRERLVGQINEYLGSVGVVLPEAESLDLIEQRISVLEAEVGDFAMRKNRESIAGGLTATITALCRELRVEFPNNKVRINFESFTLEVEFGSNWVRLAELGSGANWLGYHLGAMVGLHRLFIKQQSPVPQFLMLDQPSQVWFPAEVAALTKRSAPTKDDDLLAVKRVYDFLHQVSSGPAAPQIVVVDHARLDDDRFKEATVADWHGDAGLVPAEWID